MVVAELQRWGAPWQLCLCLVLLACHDSALQEEAGLGRSAVGWDSVSC